MARTVTRAGEPITCSRASLVAGIFAAQSGQVVTRRMMLENVWNYQFDPQTNVNDEHISRLRAKIDRDFTPPLLHTIRGAGYMMRAEDG